MNETSGWPPGAGEMAARVRRHDWSATPLGAISEWPQSLRTTTDLVLANAVPLNVLWGPSLVQIYNDGYRDLMGDRHPAGLGMPTRESWPEGWQVNQAIYDRVLHGETITSEDALYPGAASGVPAADVAAVSYSPVRDEAGIVAGVLVTCCRHFCDADAARRVTGLVHELQHRTRNLIAVVRAIARETVATTTTSDEFETRFGDRLEALSRIHGLLSRSAVEPITVDGLIGQELVALGTNSDRDRIHTVGQAVEVPAHLAQTLGLVIHELATNALRHGALSTSDGTLRIEWQRIGDDLQLVWNENGIQKERAKQAGTGYGRRVIEDALPYSHGATTSYVLNDEGLRCQISLPLGGATGAVHPPR